MNKKTASLEESSPRMPSIATLSFLDENGNLDSKCSYNIPDEELVRGYKTMVLTRQLDEMMFILQRQGAITFSLDTRGEEAAAVASAAALSFEDWLFPQYREAGIMFWRKFSIEDFLHGMFCNAKDIHLGRQMPIHFGSKKLNVVTVSSPLSTQLLHATGSAYAMKTQKEKNVSLVYFGDGGASEGEFYSSLNFASVLGAPVIFFCRNNGYAISTPGHQQRVSDGVAQQSLGIGVKTWRVDGNDYFAVHAAVAAARSYCIKNNKPALIEAMTYRMGPHSTADDPSRYRSNEEVEEWKKRDPIKRLKIYLESKKLWNEEKEKEYIAFLEKEIDIAVEECRKTPKPPLESLIEDVWFETPQHLKDELENIKGTIPCQ